MSRFFTYEELRKNFPTPNKVIEARDILHQHMIAKAYPNSTLYGSSIWSLNPSFGSKHSRRSDIDIAIFEAHDAWHGDNIATARKLEDICFGVPESTGVSVDLAVIGAHDYMQNVNPSTAEHFRLLAQTMPDQSFNRFMEYIKVSTRDRLEDIKWYLDLALNCTTAMMNVGRRRWISPDPRNLKILSRLENFPDHIARKFLGIVSALPCPDSKDNVRRAFMEHQYRGPLREFLGPTFEKMFSLSDDYERLIGSIKEGTSEQQFYNVFSTIALEMVYTSWTMLGRLGPNVESWLEESRPEYEVKEYVTRLTSRLKSFF